ncbi:DUF637 domain-containing protein [Pseudomonas sp. SWRI18]|uniref:two-partner secretion domain-containing protein n=1 Tax=Pseudomonas sp. SWRI18 TaxID=2753888 RepID=UPI001EE25193|nr:DUF637 domain-containing protein [Pseudomonas sp. SWRI18]
MDVRQFAFLARQPSAAVKTRSSFLGLPKRGLALVLANAMFWQPLLAQADGIVVSAPGTSLGQAGNGVPIVNIAAPNGSGLSYNQFSDYNVGQQGVILNNATGRTQSTQLGGIILGNPNLKGNAANVILNEVNGGSPSQLRGFTEVAGQSAHVIVANPYGITCNGCGFINTPHATLTTGKAVIENGQVSRYQVDQGSVSIEGAGLNANNVDSFEIIARSARINAEIQAKNLAIIAGTNDVDAKTLKATARASDPATKPQLAIDSSALGGMYAGAIKLVSSEAGVGVKLDGKMAASAGDIQIDANGDLTVAQVAAEGAMAVKAASADMQGTVYAASVDIQTRDALAIQQNIAARDLIKLGSQGQLTNNAIVEAGVNVDNTRNTTGDIKFRAQGMRNNGTLVASRDVRGAVSQTLDNSGGTLSAQRVTKITAGTLDNRDGGRVLSADRTRINADTLLNSQGKIYSQGGLRIVSADLNNRGGEISSKAGISVVGGKVDNSGSGSLISEQTLSINAEQLLNQLGLISGLQGVEVTGGKLDNSDGGKLSSLNGAIDVKLTGDLDNSKGGALVSQKALTVEAANIDNRTGSLSSGGAQILIVNDTLDNSDKGQIDSGESLGIAATTLRNASGTVSSQLGLTVTGTDVDNTSGSFATNAEATLDLLGTLTNTKGTVASVGDLLLKRADQVDNQGGQLASQSMMTLLIGGLDNRNGGTVAANGQLLLTATGKVQNDNDGLIYSKNANLNLHAASVENSKGTLQSQTALVLETDGGVDNLDGKIIAQDGELSVTADNVDNRGGTLSSLKNAFTARLVGVLKNGYDLDGKGGTVQASALDLRALAGINNNGGRIAAQNGDALIDTKAADFDNRDGGLYAKQRVIITANNLDNSGDKGGQISGQQIDLTLDGDLNNRLGIVESDSTLDITAASIDNHTGKLRALGASGITRFQIGGLLDNQRGLLETANNDISLAAARVLNTGGSVRHTGKGNFGVSSTAVMNAGGSFVTGGELTLDADSWTNSGVIQAGTLNVNVKDFTQTATGQLLASTAFVGTGGTWANDGVIGSDGTLSLKLSGAYSGSGQVVSLAELSMGAARLDLNSVASIKGGGKTDITVTGQLNNYGRLTSGGDMTVTAAGLANYGALAASQDLTLIAQTLLNDQAQDGSRGFIFSGRKMGLQAGSLKNRYADIYALGNLMVSGTTPGSSAQSLENSSGSIEAGGDIDIAVTNFVNQRDRFNMEQVVTGGFMTISCVQHCRGPNGPDVRGPVFIYKTVESTVSEDSPMATLAAGRNLTINSTTALNQYSLLSATNDLTITSTNLTNKAALSASGTSGHEVGAGNWVTSQNFYGLMSAVSAYDQKHPRSGPFDPVAFGQLVARFDPNLFYGINDPVIVQADGKAVAPAIIQAGGASKLTAANDIRSIVVQKTSSSVDERSANTNVFSVTQPSTVLLNRQLPPDLAQLQVDPTALPGFSLPAGQNGLFRLNAQDSASAAASHIAGVQGLPNSITPLKPPKYLIETNPALTDLKQFMSSDYLLTRLGYDPDTSAKRLGDGLYEQRLVQQAVVARTGQAFIAGQTSNEDQFKYLMNNAIASKEQLNLAVGVTLTSQQVAALTHDIVWLEEHEVNGEKVLVPVLYMAQANNRLAPNGALIQGAEVTVIAGRNLENVGTLKATSNLSAVAGQELVNSGLMQAGGRLDLLANKDLTNRAGAIIAGKDVALTSVTGDVVNERTVTTSQIAYGKDQVRNDYANSAARVEAVNDLSISAGRDINNIGGSLQGGRDVVLNAGRDVNIVSAQTTNSLDRGVNRNSSTTQYSANVSSGRDISVKAGSDLNVVASQIDAKRDIDMAAAENITISSAADEQHFLYKSKKLKIQEDHVSQVKSEITAGGNIDLDAGKNLTLVASRIAAGDEAYLAARDKLQLLAAQNSDYSLFDEKKKGSWGSKKTQRDEVTDVKNIGSEITTGGDLSLVSGGDQRYQVAKLNSGKDLTLDSGGSITFEAVKDLHQETHEKSNNSMAWTSMSGKGHTDETVRQTQMIAQGELVIKAVDGLKIDIKQVNQQTVHQVIETMVAADPQLAWLAEAEKRGDVDWRRVEEIHTSFKYSHSGLGPAAQVILAIALAVVTGGAGLGAGLVGASAGTFTAGFANTVLAAVMNNAANSMISNKGNLSSTFKDITSKDAMKGYVVSGLMGGIAGTLGYDPTKLGFDWNSAGQVVLKTGADTLVQTAINGGSLGDNFANNLLGAVINIAGAVAANQIGEINLVDGSPTKIAAHALLGGLKSMAMGGDFQTGALAGGANEALVQYLAELVLPDNYNPNLPGNQQAQVNLLAMSQLLGVLAAVVTGGDPELAANITANATQYNYLSHSDLERASKELLGCGNETICAENAYAKYHDLSMKQTAQALIDCGNNPQMCAKVSMLVAEAEADSARFRAIADSASPAVARVLNLLIAENYGFQNELAGVTAGHTAEAVADVLVRKFSITPERAAAFVAGVVVTVAAINAAKGGSGAKGTGTGKAPYTSTVSPDAEAGMPYAHPVKEAGAKAPGGQLTLALILLTCRVNCRGTYLMQGTLRTKPKPLGFSRLLALIRIIGRDWRRRFNLMKRRPW